MDARQLGLERVETASRHSLGSVVDVRLIVLLVISAAALLLRLVDLGTASLDMDEALSVVFAAKPLPELIRLTVTEDIHPPLHPVLLHLWMSVAGTGEAAARFPSVLFGVATVPLIYVAGEHLESMARPGRVRTLSLVGLVGAVMAATSAFYVGYSQEARNYTAVTFLGLLSSYLLLRALPSSGWKTWVAYGFATGAAVYMNYTAALLLPFHLLFVVATWRSYYRAWRRWALVVLTVLIAYLPWLPFAIAQMFRINDYYAGTLQLDVAVRTSLLLFVAGGGVGSNPAMLPIALGVLLLAGGLIGLAAGKARRGSGQHALFLVLYFLVPSVMLFAIAYDRPKFDPRYLMIATPAFYLILSWGIASLLDSALQQRFSVVVRVVLAVLGIAALAGTVAASSVYGERGGRSHVGDGATDVARFGDYRELMNYIESRAQPGDAVALMMNVYQPYEYYSTKGIPWYEMQPFGHFDGAIIRLNRIAEKHDRIWFVLWQTQWADPAGYVMHVMETQSKEVPLDRSFEGPALRLFELEPGKKFSYYPEVENRASVYFGDETLEFWGWNASANEVAAGGAVEYDLHWIPQKEVEGKLKTKVLLMDGENHLWAVVDEMTVTPFFPTSAWEKGVILHDRHTLRVPAGVPPGDYQALLLLYDEATMQDLSITHWDRPLGTLYSLGGVKVTPTSASSFGEAAEDPVSSWRFGDDALDVMRSRVSRTVAKAGELVEMELLWRTAGSVSGDYEIRLALLDAGGGVAAEQAFPLVRGYPARIWRAGEPVISRHWVQLPASLAPGTYRLAVDVSTVGSADRAATQHRELSTLEVRDPAQHPDRSPGEDRVLPQP